MKELRQTSLLWVHHLIDLTKTSIKYQNTDQTQNYSPNPSTVVTLRLSNKYIVPPFFVFRTNSAVGLSYRRLTFDIPPPSPIPLPPGVLPSPPPVICHACSYVIPYWLLWFEDEPLYRVCQGFLQLDTDFLFENSIFVFYYCGFSR